MAHPQKKKSGKNHKPTVPIPAVSKAAFDNVLDRLIQTAPMPRDQVRPLGQAPKPIVQK
jgi:hypothetical protein